MAVSREIRVLAFIVIVVTLLKIVPGDYSGKFVFNVVFEQGKAAVVMDITFRWIVERCKISALLT